MSAKNTMEALFSERKPKHKDAYNLILEIEKAIGETTRLLLELEYFLKNIQKIKRESLG